MSRKPGPKDINQMAASIIGRVTGETETQKAPIKDPAAVALGRKGGLKGGKARAEKLSPRKRKEIAKKAAKARWAKPYVFSDSSKSASSSSSSSSCSCSPGFGKASR